MTSWGHKHTFAGGFVAALLLGQHLWLFAGLCFTLGLLTGRLWYYEALFAEAMRRRLHLAYDAAKQRKAARARADRLREQERIALERMGGIPY